MIIIIVRERDEEEEEEKRKKRKDEKETTRLKEADELRHDLEQESSIEDRDLHV